VEIIDLIVIAQQPDDPVGPMEPSAASLREVQKRVLAQFDFVF
jgi:hypothetical protein